MASKASEYGRTFKMRRATKRGMIRRCGMAAVPFRVASGVLGSPPIGASENASPQGVGEEIRREASEAGTISQSLTEACGERRH